MEQADVEQILPGIWKMTLGEPEANTPMRMSLREPKREALDALPHLGACPIDETQVVFRAMQRGFHVRLPLRPDEQIYGLGLQLNSFNQRRKKKTLRVNSDPRLDLGDSHAPVPFYVSTAGYGVLVDTSRYATFAFSPFVPRDLQPTQDAVEHPIGQSYDSHHFYDWVTQDRNGPVLIDIPTARGVDLYIFAGPQLIDAVRRYNLFSGGGCLPPRWGLGVWYRVNFNHNQAQTIAAANDLRADRMPCDVIGLEPGWQGHAYPCSHTWNASFPEPGPMIETLKNAHFRVNLWTHVFTHASSPLYEALQPVSGDFQVLGGLVPDLLLPEARDLMAGHYSREHIALGVSGYKLDECDNTDYNAIHWSFPESTQFPSGADGEVMHSLLGVKFQEMIDDAYRQADRRTYGNARSSYALAAPLPFVLYSDLYDPKEFIRGLVNSGFSGLLWTPEVRDARSEEDLIRRLQVVVLSPQALINAWYIINPPWKQWRREENNRGEFLENWQDFQAACRHILNLRMQLLPYLYAAFERYHAAGIPPFRALVMDYAADPAVFEIDDQWMIGDRLMAAPVTAGQSRRVVYLPEGTWFDFWTGERLDGGKRFEVDVPLEKVPLYVRGNAVLPLAQPTLHTEDSASLNLSVRVYGDGSLPCTLVEDDGDSLAFEKGELNRLTLRWDPAARSVRETREGSFPVPAYRVQDWSLVG